MKLSKLLRAAMMFEQVNGDETEATRSGASAARRGVAISIQSNGLSFPHS